MNQRMTRTLPGSTARRPRRWPRRAAEFDQGVWVLLILGAFVLLAGVLGLFLGLDGAATAACVIAGAALCGLAAVLFSAAAPRYVGSASLLAETLFDYTDAKARLAALDLPEQLREPFRRLARGEAAQAYLESVLRNVESAQAGDDGEGTGPLAITPAVDAERIAESAVDRARLTLVPSGGASAQLPNPDARAVPLPGGGTTGSDTLDQPLPQP